MSGNVASCATVAAVPPRSSLVDDHVAAHVRAHGAALISVCASPAGLSSYLAGADDEAQLREVRHEAGAVVCRTEHTRFGTLLAVLGGPTVIEVCLHRSEDERAAYREAVAAVDGEHREQAVAAIQAAATAIVAELGISVGDEEEDQRG